MKLSAVNSYDYSFTGRNKKKKLNKKSVGKAVAAAVVVAGAYSFATQRGKGGLVDLAIEKMQPAKDFLAANFLKAISKIRK